MQNIEKLRQLVNVLDRYNCRLHAVVMAAMLGETSHDWRSFAEASYQLWGDAE